MLVINDTHLGVNRAGGTTPVSRLMLAEYTLQQFDSLISMADDYCLINGDLLDGFLVDNRTLQSVFRVLSAHLNGGLKKLYLARGNHDLSKDSTKLSSFDLLGFMLTEAFPGRVVVITEPKQIQWADGCGLVLPHAPNQDVFDTWLQRAPELAPAGSLLFVHANYNNGFAAEADHSLNVSPEQAAVLGEHFRRIVFGHEHQARNDTNGLVVVVGNQFPTSVSDCLGNDRKTALSVRGGELYPLVTWEAAGSFYQVDWSKTHMVPEGTQFIRVTGEASDEQASDVLEAISRLRKAHKAFVISNAVTINGQALDASALDAVEAVQQFNILDFLYDCLTPAQVDRLKGYAAEKENNNA